jgi:hypothetical protein
MRPDQCEIGANLGLERIRFVIELPQGYGIGFGNRGPWGKCDCREH